VRSAPWSDSQRNDKNYALAWSFLSLRSMSSWNPKTMTSGEASDLRTDVKKAALSAVEVSCSGLAASMFQVQMRTCNSRYVQNSDSRSRRRPSVEERSAGQKSE
jgi:hypothetical protein